MIRTLPGKATQIERLCLATYTALLRYIGFTENNYAWQSYV